MRPFNGFDMIGREMTEQELDAQLASAGQQKIRQAIKSMPEDTVSMAWRSNLNERLMASVSARRRKRRLAWIMSPALGLGVAGVFALTLFTKTPEMPNPQPSTSGNVEASLVASFKNSIDYTDVTGVGLNPDEVVSKARSASYDPNSDFDFGSL